MTHYGICYSKEGPARFISHLDMVRTFERAIRRAGLPVAFSQGFNPHPKFSFGCPLPVGIPGREEYMEIELVSELSPAEIEEKLNLALPGGIAVLRSFRMVDNAPAIMALIDSARYKVQIDFQPEIDFGRIASCISHFLSLPGVSVVRKSKDGKEKYCDIRKGIFRLELESLQENSAVLEMVIKTGSTGNIRPDEVVSAFTGHCGLPVAEYGVYISREALYGPGGSSLESVLQKKEE
ncbi:hypothetical protein DCCM_3996 [Desulfocucumis palustris]|uniref:DUF2344 domain-containing protein n=1 Tax=Desulfocucumis palustris TaxID=1898651 RepID=A0A2L2XKR2_9FIRM|nr:TIGR03936 family radical SAM-associated protein [Desulfocucumis palustris]GBF34876.1 hypothetical protein DCCM_3996 [Desulfocucumis palustris]